VPPIQFPLCGAGRLRQRCLHINDLEQAILDNPQQNIIDLATMAVFNSH
jgi:hypothetical protein